MLRLVVGAEEWARGPEDYESSDDGAMGDARLDGPTPRRATSCFAAI